MTPVKFPGAVELKKPPSMTDEECTSLWVYRQDNTCISLWTASFWQRLKFLFHGHIWIGIISGITQPPIWLDCKDDIFVKPERKPVKKSWIEKLDNFVTKIMRLEK